jgi:hypothetical protein
MKGRRLDLVTVQSLDLAFPEAQVASFSAGINELLWKIIANKPKGWGGARLFSCIVGKDQSS